MRGFSRFSVLAVVLASALVLQACGGGGDAGPAPAPAPVNVCASVSGTPTVGTATVVVSGVATYASVPNDPVNGALVYSAAVNKPIRGATVQALSCAGVVLASTTSNEQGGYVLAVPSNTAYILRARAELLPTAGPATWNVSVKDNTAAGGPALYVLDDAPASSGTANHTRSLFAASGWTGSAYTAARSAAPFAILDTIYSGIKLVAANQPTVQFPLLTAYWSPNNAPVGGDRLELGEIGNSFFFAEISGPNATRSIYFLGKAELDTDEFDTSVVAHEFGHYLQSAFSTNHSTGGPHGGDDKLDMTLAFSEGWGNAWSSMVRNDPIYADSSGPAQASGGITNLDQPPADAERGWYREDSVQSSLYALYKSSGFTPIWTALTGPMTTSQDALATIFSFADAIRRAGNVAVTASLNTILSGQNISTGPTADQWGTGEVNNGDDTGNLPIYNRLGLNTTVQTCFINTNLMASDGPGFPPNKLGTVKYYRVTLPSAGVRTITASFPTGRDIDFEVFQNRQLVRRADSSAPDSEVASLPLNAGEVIIRVYDFVTSSPLTAPNCASLTIN